MTAGEWGQVTAAAAIASAIAGGAWVWSRAWIRANVLPPRVAAARGRVRIYKDRQHLIGIRLELLDAPPPPAKRRRRPAVERELPSSDSPRAD